MNDRLTVQWRLAVLVALVAALAGSAGLEAERIVAIGDLHGGYDSLVKILRRAGLVDEANEWSGGDTILVQTGDLLDRGVAVREVVELLRSLQEQAPEQGGQVMVLMGNHEAMNLLGITRDVAPEIYARFANEGSAVRLEAAYKDYLKWARQRAKRVGGERPETGAEAKQAWMERYPAGYLEYQDALSPTAELGAWLRSLPTVIKIGEVVFLHGGISPALATWSQQRINERVWGELRDYDECRRVLIGFRVIHQTADPAAMVEYGMAELQSLVERIPHTPQPLADQLKERARILQECVDYEDWFLIKEDGPLWFRGFARWSEEEGWDEIGPVLAGQSARHFVVGHTPQLGAGITERFGGGVFLIDTGILTSFYRGGRASALEIADGRFTALYEDRRELLYEADPGVLEEAPAEAPSANRRWRAPGGGFLPFANDDEVLAFLRTARVTSAKRIKQGINQPYKLTLEQDGIEARAVFRSVEVEKVNLRMPSGRFFRKFRDSHRFEVAAFELSRLLGVDNVPPVVLRRFRGQDGSMQLWIENAIDEKTRIDEGIDPPGVWWVQQRITYRLFDALIANIDRHAGNLLIDRDAWRIFLIDHTRSFFEQQELEKEDQLIQAERRFFEALKTTDRELVRKRLASYLSDTQIDFLFVRWDRLVERIEGLIRRQGEGSVLFDATHPPAS